MSSPTDCEVLIVGAGPVGLLVTLSLAKAGIHATLIESLPDIDESPRAMAYGAAAVVELERAGIAADARAVGMEPSDYDHRLRWITIDNELIAEFKPEDRLEGSLDPVICGQHALAKVMERHLGECPSGKVSLMLSWEVGMMWRANCGGRFYLIIVYWISERRRTRSSPRSKRHRGRKISRRSIWLVRMVVVQQSANFWISGTKASHSHNGWWRAMSGTPSEKMASNAVNSSSTQNTSVSLPRLIQRVCIDVRTMRGRT
jgi:hypothetical protein